MTTTPPGTASSRNAFVVLGMHRSGTSSVAGALALLGATPPRTLMGPAPDNPNGFWESEVLMAFNDEILEKAGSAWDDPGPLDADLLTGAGGAAFHERAVTKLGEEFGDASTIVLKDPRICRFYPFWRGALTAAGYHPLVVMPIRHPAEVAASLHARNGMPLEQGLALWRRHVEDAEAATRGQPRRVMIWRDFLADWRGEIALIARALGLAEPRPDPETARSVDAFLDPGLSQRTGGDLPQAPAAVQHVYDRLARLSLE